VATFVLAIKVDLIYPYE